MMDVRTAARFGDVRMSAIRRIAALRRDSSIDLGLGEPDLLPPEWIRDEAARVARDGSWKYSANAGASATRDRIASYAGVEPGNVCVTAGAEEALFAVMQAFIGSGDQVLVPDPGFLAYPTLVRLAGGDPVSYALEPGTWQLDLEHLTSRISDRTRMIVVNSPSNPTGGVLPPSDLEALAELARRHSLIVVFDEVYREIWFDSEPAPFPSWEGLLRIGGMSKSHAMTGLRLGWVLGAEALLAPVIVAHQYIATCASVFSQQLAETVLANRERNLEWLKTVREHFLERRSVASQSWLEHVGTPVLEPGGAFYLFAPVPSCATEAFALTLAREDDVLVVPGSAFGARGEGWLRISYAAEPAQLREGIGRIASRLEQLER